MAGLLAGYLRLSALVQCWFWVSQAGSSRGDDSCFHRTGMAGVHSNLADFLDVLAPLEASTVSVEL